MSPSQQVREGAISNYAEPVAPAQESWEPSGWEREQAAIEAQRKARDEASDSELGAAAAPRRGAMGIWMKSLGSMGFLLGSACAGYFAHQMGYDWRASATIAALAGVAGGAAGVMLPLLLRAIGWAILAALAGSVGGAALYVLMRVAPAFVDRIMDVIRDVIR